MAVVDAHHLAVEEEQDDLKEAGELEGPDVVDCTDRWCSTEPHPGNRK